MSADRYASDATRHDGERQAAPLGYAVCAARRRMPPTFSPPRYAIA